MVFKPYKPVWCLNQLISGTVMLIAATVVILKIHFGSKNQFAYVLMLFTVLFGIAFVGLALVKAFRREVELPDNKTKYFINFQANNYLYYLQLLSAV